VRQVGYLPELLILNVNRYNNPFTGLDRPVGLQEVEASRIFRQSAHEGGKVVSCTHRPPLPSGGYPWYSFLLEAGSTPGSLYGWKGYVIRTHDLPACSAVPQPTAPPRTYFTTRLLKTNYVILWIGFDWLTIGSICGLL
jgi:hypothetical protein